MKKFKISVIRTDEYEIEVDENAWNKKELKKWSSTFYPVYDQEDFAKILAESITRKGSEYGFHEGFGYVKMFNPYGEIKKQFREGFKEAQESDYTPGLTVKIIEEDGNYEFEIEEIKINN